jgi:uncharacterized protein YdaU (DUF1376 family)
MQKVPQFPLFVRNWLCSRKILQMSGDAVKAYAYLLCEAWLQVPRATLPNNDAELSSMARVSLDKWLTIKSDVLLNFNVGTCEEHLGRLYNELQLDLSRKYENKQRFNNKNAKKRKVNTKRAISLPLPIALSPVNTKDQKPPSAGAFDKKNLDEIKCIINNEEIPNSFFNLVLKECRDDRHQAGRIFFRAKIKATKTIKGWIMGGLVNNKDGKKYAFDPITEESNDPRAVQDFIDNVVEKYRDAE